LAGHRVVFSVSLLNVVEEALSVEGRDSAYLKVVSATSVAVGASRWMSGYFPMQKMRMGARWSRLNEFP